MRSITQQIMAFLRQSGGIRAVTGPQLTEAGHLLGMVIYSMTPSVLTVGKKLQSP